MTKQDKIDAFVMRLDGYTLQQIGDKFGVTKERIRQIVGNNVTTENRIDRTEKIIYPNIKKWAIAHNKTPHQIYMDINCSKSTKWLTVHGSYGPSLESIKKILNYTGLTFEEAFGDQT